MSNWKLYISAGIFVVVTVLKLLLPDATAQMRQEIVMLVDMDMDYRGMVAQVGSMLTDDSVQQVLNLIKREAQEVIGQTSPTPTQEPTPAPTNTPEPTVEPTVSPTPTPTPEVAASVIAAVEAFHLAQEVYGDYKTPETVSYDALVIPFSYASPLSGVTSSGFGYRIHPIENEIKFHFGTDYAAPMGTAITAFADGEVTMTGYEEGYGNYVQLTHADGWKTLYAHCSKVTVSLSQQVKKGEAIALVGQTGEATGPHLHLELTHDGYFTNPEFFF